MGHGRYGSADRRGALKQYFAFKKVSNLIAEAELEFLTRCDRIYCSGFIFKNKSLALNF